MKNTKAEDRKEKLISKKPSLHSLDFVSEECGQQVELCTEIRDVLRQYPFGLSTLKEYIQNSEDAKSSTLKFFVDYRNIGVQLKGPSLIIFNDRKFTEEDVHNLRSFKNSNKRADLANIGKFGQGFNVSYHFGDIVEIFSDGFYVILDPNNIITKKNGKRVNWFGHGGEKKKKIVEEKKLFEQMFFPGVPFGVKNFPNERFEGSIIRIKLRNEKEAKKSEISEKVHHPDEIVKLILELTDKLQDCLLFQKNLRTVEVYTNNNPKNECKMIYRCEAKMKPKDINTREKIIPTFKKIINKQIEYKKNSLIMDFDMELGINKVGIDKYSEKYIICHTLDTRYEAFQMTLNTKATKFSFRLLPMVGIAIQISERKDFNSGTRMVFVNLPIGINTSLPFHLNGRFELTPNRQNLILEKTDKRYKWNSILLKKLSPKTYIRVLKYAQKLLLKDTDPKNNIDEICKYLSLFPWRMGLSEMEKVINVSLLNEMKDNDIIPISYSDKFAKIISYRLLVVKDSLVRNTSAGKLDEWEMLWMRDLCEFANEKIGMVPYSFFRIMEKNFKEKVKLVDPDFVVNLLKKCEGNTKLIEEFLVDIWKYFCENKVFQIPMKMLKELKIIPCNEPISVAGNAWEQKRNIHFVSISSCKYFFPLKKETLLGYLAKLKGVFILNKRLLEVLKKKCKRAYNHINSNSSKTDSVSVFDIISEIKESFPIPNEKERIEILKLIRDLSSQEMLARVKGKKPVFQGKKKRGKKKKNKTTIKKTFHSTVRRIPIFYDAFGNLVSLHGSKGTDVFLGHPKIDDEVKRILCETKKSVKIINMIKEKEHNFVMPDLFYKQMEIKCPSIVKFVCKYIADVRIFNSIKDDVKEKLFINMLKEIDGNNFQKNRVGEKLKELKFVKATTYNEKEKRDEIVWKHPSSVCTNKLRNIVGRKGYYLHENYDIQIVINGLKFFNGFDTVFESLSLIAKEISETRDFDRANTLLYYLDANFEKIEKNEYLSKKLQEIGDIAWVPCVIMDIFGRVINNKGMGRLRNGMFIDKHWIYWSHLKGICFFRSDKFIKMGNFFRLGRKPNDSETFKQISKIAEAYNSLSEKEKNEVQVIIRSRIQEVYTHLKSVLSDKIKKIHKNNPNKRINVPYDLNKPWIWSGFTNIGFVESKRVAIINFNFDLPANKYLIFLPELLFPLREIFLALHAKEKFEFMDYVNALSKLKNDCQKNRRYINFVDEMVNIACKIVVILAKFYGKIQPTFNRSGYMVVDPKKVLELWRSNRNFLIPTTENQFVHISEVVINDADWIKTNFSKKSYCHSSIPPSFLKKLGVKSIGKSLFLKEKNNWKTIKYSAWGEKKAISTPVYKVYSDILKQYKQGISIFNEQLQNSDDAGASVIKIIFSEMEFGKQKLTSKNMKDFQGSAVYVYNNAVFNEVDFKGIRSPLDSNKTYDLRMTGRFGKGSVTLFHVGDLYEVCSNTSIAMVDPTKAIEESEFVRFNFLKNPENLENYSDQFVDPFKIICEKIGIDMDLRKKFNGTLFRVPCRTKDFCNDSKLKNTSFNKYDFLDLVNLLKKNADKSLLFSRDVSDLEVLMIDKNGNVKSLLSVKKESKKQLKKCFDNSLSAKKAFGFDRPQRINPYSNAQPSSEEVTIEVKTDGNFSSSKFLVSFACDPELFKHPLVVKNEHFPFAGVAVKIMGEKKNEEGCFFTSFVLPVKTTLPCHIFGDFVINVLRTKLITSQNHTGRDKTDAMFNDYLFKRIIGKCYLKCLDDIRERMRKRNYSSRDEAERDLSFYYDLFPEVPKRGGSLTIVTKLKKFLYEKISEGYYFFSDTEEMKVYQSRMIRRELKVMSSNEKLRNFLKMKKYPVLWEVGIKKSYTKIIKRIDQNDLVKFLRSIQPSTRYTEVPYSDSYIPDFDTLNQILFFLGDHIRNEDIKSDLQGTFFWPLESNKIGKVDETRPIFIQKPNFISSDHNNRFLSRNIKSHHTISDIPGIGLKEFTPFDIVQFGGIGSKQVPNIILFWNFYVNYWLKKKEQTTWHRFTSSFGNRNISELDNLDLLIVCKSPSKSCYLGNGKLNLDNLRVIKLKYRKYVLAQTENSLNRVNSILESIGIRLTPMFNFGIDKRLHKELEIGFTGFDSIINLIGNNVEYFVPKINVLSEDIRINLLKNFGFLVLLKQRNYDNDEVGSIYSQLNDHQKKVLRKLKIFPIKIENGRKIISLDSYEKDVYLTPENFNIDLDFSKMGVTVMYNLGNEGVRILLDLIEVKKFDLRTMVKKVLEGENIKFFHLMNDEKKIQILKYLISREEDVKNIQKIIRESNILVGNEGKLLKPCDSVSRDNEILKMIFQSDNRLIPRRYMENESWKDIFSMIQEDAYNKIPMDLNFDRGVNSEKMTKFFISCHKKAIAEFKKKVFEYKDTIKIFRFFVSVVSKGYKYIEKDDLSEILKQSIFLCKKNKKLSLLTAKSCALYRDRYLIKGVVPYIEHKLDDKFVERLKRQGEITHPPNAKKVFERLKKVISNENLKDMENEKILKLIVPIYAYFSVLFKKEGVSYEKFIQEEEGNFSSPEMEIFSDMRKMDCCFVSRDIGFKRAKECFLEGNEKVPGYNKIHESVAEEYRMFFLNLGCEKSLDKTQSNYAKIDLGAVLDGVEGVEELTEALEPLKKTIVETLEKISMFFPKDIEGGKDWIATAERDQRASEVLLKNNCWEQACFYSEQVAEKCLKGVLLAKGELRDVDTKQHKILPLFNRLSEKTKKKIQPGINFLDNYYKFYIQSRYPKVGVRIKPQDLFNKEVATKAVKAAKMVLLGCIAVEI